MFKKYNGIQNRKLQTSRKITLFTDMASKSDLVGLQNSNFCFILKKLNTRIIAGLFKKNKDRFLIIHNKLHMR